MPVLDGRRESCSSKANRSKHLLLFVFTRRSVCHYSMAEENPAAQRQTVVSAYFTSKQLLLYTFGFE